VEVALDAEWKDPRPLSLVQLAVRHHSKVEIMFLDMLEQHTPELVEWVRNLLSRARTLLVFSPSQDFARLRMVGILEGEIRHVDLQRMYSSIKWKKIGLASLARTHLGEELDKKMQRSNWDQRPLSLRQIAYAARDASVLFDLWDRMSEICDDDCNSLNSDGDRSVTDLSERFYNEDGSIRLALSTQDGKAIRILRGMSIDCVALPGSMKALRRQKNRYLIMRSPQKIEERQPGIHYIDVGHDSKSTDDFVRAITSTFNIQVAEDDLCGRCTKCNARDWLVIEKDGVKEGELRPCIVDRYDFFYRCGHCSKLYWHGGMWETAKKRLRDLAASSNTEY